MPRRFAAAARTAGVRRAGLGSAGNSGVGKGCCTHRAGTRRSGFIFSRNQCEDAARSVVGAGIRLTTAAERDAIAAIVGERLSGLDQADLAVLGYGDLLTQLEAGVAPHHAGMVPAFKEAVEQCFIAGLLKVVFATETLAVGVNMPARTVVIEKLTKFTGDHHEVLTPGEYTQLTGRAGRRGIDEV